MKNEEVILQTCKDVITNNPDKKGSDIFKTELGLNRYQIARKQYELENKIKIVERSMDVLLKINKQYNNSNEMYSTEYWKLDKKLLDLKNELEKIKVNE